MCERVALRRVPRNHWSKLEIRQCFLRYLANRLSISSTFQWYSITRRDVIKCGGRSFLERYGGSMQRALADLCGENVEWLPWRFQAVSPGFWNQKIHRENFLCWIAKQLFIERNEQWYSVTKRDLIELGGSGFLQRCGGTVQRVLVKLCPEFSWDTWRFEGVSRGYWALEFNRRRYFEWLQRDLGVQDENQWYSVTARDIIIRPGGRSFLRNFSATLDKQQKYALLLQNCVVNEKRKYRHDSELSRSIICRPDIYVEQTSLINFHSSYRSLLNGLLFSGFPSRSFSLNLSSSSKRPSLVSSVQRMLLHFYPSRPWFAWLFRQVPAHFWDSTEYRSLYLRWLERCLRIETPSQWFLVSRQVLQSFRGPFASRYGGWIPRMLSELSPHIVWFPWYFTHGRVPRDVALFERVSWLEKRLCLRDPCEWSQVSKEHLARLRSASLIRKELDIGSFFIGIIPNNIDQAVNRDCFFSKRRRPQSNTF